MFHCGDKDSASERKEPSLLELFAERSLSYVKRLFEERRTFVGEEVMLSYVINFCAYFYLIG